MELIGIDSGSPEVKRVQNMIVNNPNVFGGMGITRENMNEPANVDLAIEMYRNIRKKEADEFNQASSIRQLKESVDKAVGALASKIIRKTYSREQSIPRSAIGDVKKSINSKKKAACGEIQLDKDVCMKHWSWIKNFEAQIKEQGVPTWLA